MPASSRRVARVRLVPLEVVARARAAVEAPLVDTGAAIVTEQDAEHGHQRVGPVTEGEEVGAVEAGEGDEDADEGSNGEEDAAKALGGSSSAKISAPSRRVAAFQPPSAALSLFLLPPSP